VEVLLIMHAIRLALLVVPALATGACARANAEPPPTRDISVRVTTGYDPATVNAYAGEHLRLLFTRDVEGCTSKVVFPSLGLERDLPLHQTVTVDLGTVNAGEIPFRCGADMVHGKVIVKPKG
jgi:Cu+-exporting ATPase